MKLCIVILFWLVLKSIYGQERLCYNKTSKNQEKLPWIVSLQKQDKNVCQVAIVSEWKVVAPSFCLSGFDKIKG